MTGEEIIVVDSSFARALYGTADHPNQSMRDLASKYTDELTDGEKKLISEKVAAAYKEVHGNEYAQTIQNMKVDDLVSMAQGANMITKMGEGTLGHGMGIASAARYDLESPSGKKKDAVVVTIADIKDFTPANFFPSALKYGGADVALVNNPEHLRAIMLIHELGHIMQKGLKADLKAQDIDEVTETFLYEADTDVQSRRVLKGLIPEREIDIVNAAQDLASFHGMYRDVTKGNGINFVYSTHFSHTLSDELLEHKGEMNGTPLETLERANEIARHMASTVGLNNPDIARKIVDQEGHIGYGEMRGMLEEMLADTDKEWKADEKDTVQRMIKEMDVLNIKSAPYSEKAEQYKQSGDQLKQDQLKHVSVSDFLMQEVNTGSEVTPIPQNGKMNYLFSYEGKVTAILQVDKDTDHGIALDRDGLKIHGLVESELTAENKSLVVAVAVAVADDAINPSSQGFDAVPIAPTVKFPTAGLTN